MSPLGGSTFWISRSMSLCIWVLQICVEPYSRSTFRRQVRGSQGDTHLGCWAPGGRLEPQPKHVFGALFKAFDSVVVST